MGDAVTILEAQEVIDRAFEAGYFSRTVPKDRIDGRYAERNFRIEQVRDLLGVSARDVYDYVDVDRLCYGGDPPLLRGVTPVRVYGPRPGTPYMLDKRAEEALFFWRCALWQKFVDDKGAHEIDWVEVAGKDDAERVVWKVENLESLGGEVARCAGCRTMRRVCCGTKSTTPFYDDAKCVRCCPCDPRPAR